MSDKILVAKYILEVVPNDLKLYERDGLLTYIDQLKYECFTQDPDKYQKKLKLSTSNRFRIGAGEIREHFPKNIVRPVFQSDVQKISQKERKKVVSAYLRSDRKYIFIEKKLTLSHFLGKKDDEL